MVPNPWPGGPCPEPGTLAHWLEDSRRSSLALAGDLSDEQLLGPKLAIVNPPLWEIGHLGWFQEKWVLRHAGSRPPLLEKADALYDSMAVAHDSRWELPLLSRQATLDYLDRVLEQVLTRISRGGLSETEVYFILLSIFHEDMHAEAFAYSRQTHGWPRPQGLADPATGASAGEGPWPGDVEIPGGHFRLGAEPGTGFVFDNEKWAHEVRVEPFAIARAAVTQGQYAELVAEGGYTRPELWSPEGWLWRTEARALHPTYWRPAGGGWERRDFDRWVSLEPHRPMVHVGWYEAEAFCRWAGRRLPTELEWEVAAAGRPDSHGGLASAKRFYPWDETPRTSPLARLGWAGLGTCDVAAHADSDSAFGCRQMLGNVWEWTASDFRPFPGFTPDPYAEYSAPWFNGHKVLRGGAWTTQSRLLRNTWRNFYPPHRRDVWAGFRTCPQ